MADLKTFDIMAMSTDVFTEELGSEYRELDFNKRSLKNTCELIDMFVEENEFDSITVDVDDATHDIVIAVSGIGFEYVGTANLFMKIASKAKSVGFKSPDEEHVTVTFIFDGIWEKSH